MTARTLRKRCETRLRGLPIPTPFDIRTLAEIIAARRGRPVEICAWPIPIPTLSGACFALPNLDVVFYANELSPLHRRHVILHELCHLLCGHTGVAGEELQTLLFPDLAARIPSLRREKYAGEDEQEAELLASLILARVHRTQADAPVTDARTTSVLRLLDSLEGVAFE